MKAIEHAAWAGCSTPGTFMRRVGSLWTCGFCGRVYVLVDDYEIKRWVVTELRAFKIEVQ